MSSLISMGPVGTDGKTDGEEMSARETERKNARTRDDVDLMRLGKIPQLKRNFGFMSILGFSCTVLITWEGILIVSTQSLTNGGPAGVIWGFIIVWIGTLSHFTVIAELASMAPTAGGQYHWVAMLAPKTYRRFFSYLTGWITFAGWQAATASVAYLIGTLLEGTIALTNPDYAPQPWHSVLYIYAILLVALFINTVASRSLSSLEGLILVLHIVGFFAVIIPLVYLSPHSDGSIFTTFINGGDWSTQGLSFMVGLPGSVFSLIGADSAVHMSEEIKGATLIVPKALVLTVAINGLLGLAMVIAYLFCLGSLDDALAAATGPLQYPFIEVFNAGTGSVAGAAVMTLIVVVLGICSTVGVLATSSRMLWSFSRDRGVPFSRFLVQLNRRTHIPVNTVGLTMLISMLLTLIVLGSSVAFNDIVNLSVSGLYSSYFLCCALLLWRRCRTGDIKPYDPEVKRVGPDNLHWGPWRVPGIAGVANNVFACLYLVLVWFWSFWPPQTSVTAMSMNFNVLIWGGTIVIAIVWYLVRGMRDYHGPRVEMEL